MRVPKRVLIIGSHLPERLRLDNGYSAPYSNKMISRESVHTVHFIILLFTFIKLGSDRFEEKCTLVCTETDYLCWEDKKLAKAGMREVMLSDAACWQ